MPPSLLFDISNIDLNRVLHTHDEIREVNPQRHEFEMLEAVSFADEPSGQITGFKDIRADEYWTRGHIPGRPLFPGVLQLELAAQLSGFFTKHYMKWPGFIGFGGLEEVRFRGQVLPGVRLHVLAQRIWSRHKRIASKTQGLVDGNIVFEATIIGVQF